MESTTVTNETHLAVKRIRLRIPKQFHQEPIISQLVSLYQVTVNITAALLGANASGDGWFDLELRGAETHIQDALQYLQDLELEIWQETPQDIW